jgi:hypothetical protein
MHVTTLCIDGRRQRSSRTKQLGSITCVKPFEVLENKRNLGLRNLVHKLSLDTAGLQTVLDDFTDEFQLQRGLRLQIFLKLGEKL